MSQPRLNALGLLLLLAACATFPGAGLAEPPRRPSAVTTSPPAIFGRLDAVGLGRELEDSALARVRVECAAAQGVVLRVPVLGQDASCDPATRHLRISLTGQDRLRDRSLLHQRRTVMAERTTTTPAGRELRYQSIGVGTYLLRPRQPADLEPMELDPPKVSDCAISSDLDVVWTVDAHGAPCVIVEDDHDPVPTEKRPFQVAELSFTLEARVRSVAVVRRSTGEVLARRLGKDELIDPEGRPLPPQAFEALGEWMTLDLIVQQVGPAQGKRGSGLCILAWKVTDNREFWVATTHCDRSERPVYAKFR